MNPPGRDVCRASFDEVNVPLDDVMYIGCRFVRCTFGRLGMGRPYEPQVTGEGTFAGFKNCIFTFESMDDAEAFQRDGIGQK